MEILQRWNAACQTVAQLVSKDRRKVALLDGVFVEHGARIYSDKGCVESILFDKKCCGNVLRVLVQRHKVFPVFAQVL